jgi:hypothetical protein
MIILPLFDRAGEEVNVLQLVDGNVTSLDQPPCLACPVCRALFSEKRALIEHAAEHGKAPRSDKPFKCHHCWKVGSFHCLWSYT